MKRIKIYALSVWGFLCLVPLSSYAQADISTPSTASATLQDIDWSTYSKTIDDLMKDQTKFYIYDIAHKKFISTGGQYGVQPITAESGMAFMLSKVEGNDDKYYIHSNVKNGEKGTGDCVGVKSGFADSDYADGNRNKVLIYIDRGTGDLVEWNYQKVDGEKGNAYVFFSYWKTVTASEGNTTTTTFGTTPHYIAYYSNNGKQYFVEDTEESNAGKCYLISEADYTQVITSHSYSYINISNMVLDGRFERMNKDADAWKWSKDNLWTEVGKDATTGKTNYDQLHTYLTNHAWYIKNDDLAFGAAWIGSEYDEGNHEGQELYQEIINLPAGYYRVDCQGFYRGEGLGEAYLFANDRTVRMQKLTDDDETKLNEQIRTIAKNDNERDPYLEAVLGAGKFLANGNSYQDGKKYTNSVYVKVGSDGKLRLGMKKNSRAGDVFADNFQLYYAGNREWYLSAANTNTGDWTYTSPDEGVNKIAWEYPVRYNLRRKFDVKAWNSFIVPFDIPADQVKTAFSGGTEDAQVKVSKFKEITENANSRQIIFEKVNLDQEGIKADTPYIIWVGKNADVTDKSQSYTFEYTANNNVTIKGPIYHIDGIIPKAFTECAPAYNGGSDITFHGFYYKNAHGAPAQSYVLSGGKMYHLTRTYTGNGIVGTCWYMSSSSSDAKPITFSFEGIDGETTAIENVALAGKQSSGRGDIYTLTGVKVGNTDLMPSLHPGIYIVNGKKMVIQK